MGPREIAEYLDNLEGRIERLEAADQALTRRPANEVLLDRLKVLEAESAQWRDAYEKTKDKLTKAQAANCQLRSVSAGPVAIKDEP